MVTMSAVWDRTTGFLSNHFGAVATIAALALYLPSAGQGVIQPASAVAGPGAKLGLSLLSLALSLISVFGQAALIAYVLDPARGRDAAAAQGAARFPALIGISVLLLLGLLLLGLPVFVILAAGGVDMTALAGGARPDISGGTIGATLLYLLLLVPLLLWLGARLVVVAPVVVAERRGIGAIGRSFALTRGLAAKIVGVIILFLILASVAALAAQTVFGTVLRLALGGDSAVTVAGVLTALIVALVTTGFTVLLTAFTAQLYLAARDRAETAAA